MARTGTPPREKTYVYRTGQPDRLRPLLFAVAALLIGLLVRKPFMGLNRFMEEKLEETELL